VKITLYAEGKMPITITALEFARYCLALGTGNLASSFDLLEVSHGGGTDKEIPATIQSISELLTDEYIDQVEDEDAAASAAASASACRSAQQEMLDDPMMPLRTLWRARGHRGREEETALLDMVDIPPRTGAECDELIVRWEREWLNRKDSK